MGKRAALLLASLACCGALAACVPPAPLMVAGTLPPPSTTFALVGDDAVAQAARQPLIDALARHGLRAVAERPDRFVSVTLADRPQGNGTVAGSALPPSPKASGWTDQPVKGGIFAKGRREVRLTVTFFAADGQRREERVAHGVVTRNAPAPDIARLIDAALNP